jgi:hypothetical protein
LDIGRLFVQQLGSSRERILTALRFAVTLPMVLQVGECDTRNEIGTMQTKRNTRKKIRALTMMLGLLFATAAFPRSGRSHNGGVQQASTPAENQGHARDAGLPSVEEQLKVLTEKLNLTGDQRAKIKPIMKELHDATEKLIQDEHMTQEERLAKVRPLRMKANEKIRTFLDDDQKKKLDQYLQGPHGEMHGNLTGTPSQPPPPKPPTP